MQVLQTVPLLRIFDVAKALEFYEGFLGFTIEWKHQFDDNAPAYMQIMRDGCTLHLTEHYGDCCPGSTVSVRVSGLAEYHREISAKNYRYMRPGIERFPWGADVMEVIDPFGNHIRFSEDVPEQNKSQG